MAQQLKLQGEYFGDLTDTTAGGHDIVYKYDTSNLKFVEVLQADNVISTGQGFGSTLFQQLTVQSYRLFHQLRRTI